MNNVNPLPDKAARERIVADLGTNLLVEAGAGSGKTTSLVGRMLALVRTGTADVRRIAAVTFTRKAAAELRERFQVELEQAVRTETDAAAQARLAAALAELDQAFIGTIHSFCARLLRERPVEAGLDPEFTELDTAEASRLQADVWRAFLEQMRLTDAATLAQLESLGLDQHDLRSCFELLSFYPDVTPYREPVPLPDLSPAADALAAFLCEVGRLVPQQRPLKGWDSLQAAIRRAERRAAVFDMNEPRHLVSTLELLASQVKVTQNRWHSRDDALEALAAAERFQEAFVLPVLQTWREHRHSLVIDAVLPALDAFAAERLRLGKLDFTDLLLRATALVRDRGDVRRYFTGRYSHLLVDEFQDTDPIQAELMVWLAAAEAAVPGVDWRDVSLRPGALFVVGDPKQSIYRFRRADIDTYNAMKQIIADSGGDVLHLTANFRAVHSLSDWVGRLFSHVLPPQATRFQAAFAPMNTQRPDPTNGTTALHGSMSGIRYMTSPKVPWDRAAVIAAAEAERLGDWVAWACQGNVQLPDEDGARPAAPGDFLVLFARKKHIGLYTEALEARGVPYTVAGAETFSASPELGELLKLLRAVADPDNPVPLTGALRGLFFGLSDDDLYKHRQAGGRFSLLAGGFEVADPAPGHPPVLGALATLRQYWRWARRDPPLTALTRIVEHVGLLPFAAGGEAGNSRAGIIVQALELVRSADLADAATFAAAVAWLGQRYADGGIEDQGLLPEQQQAVRLMNLHKAKGLEAPIVVLATPIGAMTHEPVMHVDRTGSDPVAHLVVRRQDAQGRWHVLAQPPGWADRAAVEADYDAAEDERLLYVAGTRARDLLIVGRYAGNPERSPWHRLEGGYDEALELPAVPAGQAALARPDLGLEAGEAPVALAAADAAAALRLEEAAVPSYAVESVTGLVKADAVGAPSPWAQAEVAAADGADVVDVVAAADETDLVDGAETGGMRWGNAVHGLLERAGRGAALDDLAALAPRVLASEGLPDADPADLLATVSTVLASDLWQRALRVDEHHVEVPFTTMLGDDAAGGSVPTMLRGVIDLAFRDENGWVLVDFKSDRVTPSTLPAYVAYYAPQLAHYAAHWTAQTGEPVVEQVLFFVTTGDVERVNG